MDDFSSMPLDLPQFVLLAIVTFAAGVISSVAGFGGAAITLPVLVALFGVRDAVPILTVAQLIGNSSRVLLNRRDIVLPVVGWYTLGAVPLALLGGVLFASAPLSALTRFLGLFLLGLVAWRHLRPGPARKLPISSFVGVGAGSSLLSALLGTAGPVTAPFFLAYGLVRGAYIGTEAMSSLVTHVMKLVAYSGVSMLTGSGLGVGLAVGVVLLAGSFAGKLALDRLPERAFILIVEGMLVVSGLTLLING